MQIGHVKDVILVERNLALSLNLKLGNRTWCVSDVTTKIEKSVGYLIVLLRIFPGYNCSVVRALNNHRIVFLALGSPRKFGRTGLSVSHEHNRVRHNHSCYCIIEK